MKINESEITSWKDEILNRMDYIWADTLSAPLFFERFESVLIYLKGLCPRCVEFTEQDGKRVYIVTIPFVFANAKTRPKTIPTTGRP
jgi:hypothetical protein